MIGNNNPARIETDMRQRTSRGRSKDLGCVTCGNDSNIECGKHVTGNHVIEMAGMMSYKSSKVDKYLDGYQGVLPV